VLGVPAGGGADVVDQGVDGDQYAPSRVGVGHHAGSQDGGLRAYLAVDHGGAQLGHTADELGPEVAGRRVRDPVQVGVDGGRPDTDEIGDDPAGGGDHLGAEPVPLVGGVPPGADQPGRGEHAEQGDRQADHDDPPAVPVHRG